MLILTLTCPAFLSVMLQGNVKRSTKDAQLLLDLTLPWNTTDLLLMFYALLLSSSWPGLSWEKEFGSQTSGTMPSLSSSSTWLLLGSLIFMLMLLKVFKLHSWLKENLKTETSVTCKEFFLPSEPRYSTSKEESTEKVMDFADLFDHLICIGIIIYISS